MKEIHIWMQLLGFERNDPDRGAARFLDRAGFVPQSVFALLFHADFVHFHNGMEKEYTLFPDNCAYHGIPCNKERERQPWTNHDLRTLVAELKKRGVGFYAGIMGSYLQDTHHHEWLSDHPEVRRVQRDKLGGLMCLKRMADGRFYEDFFAEKMVETLVDYGMEGIYLADGFCPASQIYLSDYSLDMTDQFTQHTGIVLPAELTESDETEAVNLRADYIWAQHREAWIRFYEWRWEGFFRKLCTAAHAAGKKVWVLGMYCTDPFETRYIHGFDSKRVMDAGVDCLTANVLPTSVGLNAMGRPYYFHRMHMDLPLVSAQTDKGQVVSMLGVQDAAEEWSVLEHRPVQLERDLYTITASRIQRDAEVRDAAEGLLLCLGDGIDSHHWNFLKSRIDVGFSTDAERVWSPMVLWSDTAADRMLSAYIETRRTSVHKQSYEVFKAGTPIGGALRSEALEHFNGVLFVPNFDLLSQEEQQRLLQAEFPWVGTAPAGYAVAGSPAVTFTDSFSDLPLKAFGFNFEWTEELAAQAEALLREDDGTPSTANDPELMKTALYGELPQVKLGSGFVKAMGLALQAAMARIFPLRCNRPMMAMRLKNGKDRLFLYNPHEDYYDHALVRGEEDLKSVRVAGHYPVQPPRFVQKENTAYFFDYTKKTRTNSFQVKIAPGGVTVVDVEPF